MDQSLQFILLLLVSYLGLLAGAIISHYAKEELTSGKKYFKIGRAIIFGVIVFFFFMYLKLEYLISIPASLFAMVFAFIFSNRLRHINPGLFFYSFFAVVIFESKKSDISAILASLVFIFGIFEASIDLDGIDTNLISKIRLALFSNIIYFILSFILFFLF
jgi:hypothetical protein